MAKPKSILKTTNGAMCKSWKKKRLNMAIN